MALTKKICFYGYDADWRRKVKASSLMRQMQQAAEDDLAQYGMPYDVLRSNKTVFVLSKMLICMDRDIVPYEPLLLTTIPKRIHGASFVRDFLLAEEGTDKVIMRASSVWALIDFDSRKLLRPSSLCGVIPHEEDTKVGFEAMRTLLPATLDTSVGDKKITDARRVYPSMLDENSHLNNCLYADLLTDIISREKEYGSFQINFISEAVLDDEIEIESVRSDTFEYVKGYNKTKSKPCFEAAVFDKCF